MDINGFDDLEEGLNEFAKQAEEAEARLQGAIDDGIRETAKRVEAGAKRRAPVDTTTLRVSIGYQRIAPGVWVVGTPVDYAEAVEKGTSPHTITADDGYLRFTGQNGETVFRKSVQHPGTDPNPFLRPALLDNQSELASDIGDAIEELFDEVFD